MCVMHVLALLLCAGRRAFVAGIWDFGEKKRAAKVGEELCVLLVGTVDACRCLLRVGL
jgi:hypothetical protein